MNEKNKCKNCQIIENGSIIRVEEDGTCTFCGRQVGSHPQSEGEEELIKEFKRQVESRIASSMEYGWTGGFESKFLVDFITNFISHLISKKETEAVRVIEDKYNELLMAVGNKCEGETRHETALRYIKNAEQSSAEAKSTNNLPK